MPTYEHVLSELILSIIINFVYTLIVLVLPLAIYRGIKKEAISHKKAKRIVIIYMISYCTLRIAFAFVLAAFGVEIDGTTIAPNIVSIILWSWIDIRILTNGYYGEEDEQTNAEHKQLSADVNYQKLMLDSIAEYKQVYATEHPDGIEDVIYIFDYAIQLIGSWSDREIQKLMKKYNASPELLSLNVLQNFAKTKINANKSNHLIEDACDSAYGVYLSINEHKYKNGFISKEKYEDNIFVGKKLMQDSDGHL